MSSVTPLPNASGATAAQVLDALDEVLLGKRTQCTLALTCILAQGHLLIEDVPGVGKTTLARAFGGLLGLDWKRVQFTNDLLPADVVGVSIFDTKTQEFQFQAGPVFTSLLLADEINRAPAKAQSALLEAMEERQVSVDGVTRELPDPFFVIATQNPGEQRGVFALPESQLDRFLMGVSLGYPDSEQERQLLANGDTRQAVDNLNTLVSPAVLKHWMDAINDVHMADSVLDYLHELVIQSRVDHLGLSPRAALGLVRASRAFAYIHQRDHVLPDDVKAVFASVAGHRLTGSVSAGKTASDAITSLVKAP